MQYHQISLASLLVVSVAIVASCQQKVDTRALDPQKVLDTCGPGVRPKTVVRMRIPLNFDPASGQRYVKIRKSAAEQDSSDNSSDGDASENEEDAYNSSYNIELSSNPNDVFAKQNPLHVDLSVPANKNHMGNGEQWVKFKVFIVDTRYQFYSGTWPSPTPTPTSTSSPTPTPSSPKMVYGITVPDQTPLGVICQKKDKTMNPTKDGYSAVTFYVNRHDLDGPLPVNIIIVANQNGNNGTDTPIIIDPKIKNDGT